VSSSGRFTREPQPTTLLRGPVMDATWFDAMTKARTRLTRRQVMPGGGSRLHRRVLATEVTLNSTSIDRLAIAVGQRTTRRMAFGLLAALGLTGLVREEASAVCAGPGAKCRRATAEPWCSGICKKKRCRCPQRTCCQCNSSTAVPCAYVTDVEACQARCTKLTGFSSSLTISPALGERTTVCAGTQCEAVSCLP
jgi:hypothetical protein